jgi:hypothetical protein
VQRTRAGGRVTSYLGISFFFVGSMIGNIDHLGGKVVRALGDIVQNINIEIFSHDKHVKLYIIEATFGIKNDSSKIQYFLSTREFDRHIKESGMEYTIDYVYTILSKINKNIEYEPR